MDCPVCKQPMKKGCVPSTQGPLEWCGESTVRLTKFPLVFGAEAEAFYCPDCRHVLIPVPEIETFSDKMLKKLDDATKNIQAAKEKFDSERTEMRRQKKYEKRRGKDPWEM